MTGNCVTKPFLVIVRMLTSIHNSFPKFFVFLIIADAQYAALKAVLFNHLHPNKVFLALLVKLWLIQIDTTSTSAMTFRSVGCVAGSC